MPRWREGEGERERGTEKERGREGERELLTDSSSLLLDFIGHDCLLVVLQLNAKTKVAKLDAAFATQENIGSCNKISSKSPKLYQIHEIVSHTYNGF